MNDPNALREREIRQTVFGKPMREPIAKSLEKSHEWLEQKMDPIEARHRERIVQADVDKITVRPDYYVPSDETLYTLVFTHANDT